MGWEIDHTLETGDNYANIYHRMISLISNGIWIRVKSCNKSIQIYDIYRLKNDWVSLKSYD
jgi:hypothetical protein